VPVCHTKRIVFLHVPKTAGVSVRQGLRRAGLHFDLDADGTIWPRLRDHPRNGTLVRRLKTIFPMNTIAGFGEPHLPARVLYELTPGEVRSYFSFAFVRNPWDLVVSTYHYWKKVFAEQAELGRNDPDHAYALNNFSFEEFVRAYPMFGTDMSAFLEDEYGKLPDFVGRFERLGDDFGEVCRRIGVAADLRHENATGHDHYRKFYSDETRAIVGEVFARDIQRFGYTF
jgi:Sulfotransferase family